MPYIYINQYMSRQMKIELLLNHVTAVSGDQRPSKKPHPKTRPTKTQPISFLRSVGMSSQAYLTNNLAIYLILALLFLTGKVELHLNHVATDPWRSDRQPKPSAEGRADASSHHWGGPLRSPPGALSAGEGQWEV
jgi:hypothetical protein